MRVFIVIILANFSFRLLAQKPLPGVNEPGTYNLSVDQLYKKFYRKPLNLDSVKQPEGVTARRVWRIVDFSNPENKAIFTLQSKGTDVVPLFEIILYGLYSGKIKAFRKDSWNKSTLTNSLTLHDLNQTIFYTDSLIERQYDSDGNEQVTRKLKTDTITSIKLKGIILGEDWYMDKHFSRIEKRIVTLCPVWYNEKTQKDMPLFWLYYPECRDLFSSFEANNPVYKEQRITWDQLLVNKLFIGLIVKSSNIFDRNLNSYNKGEDILIESYKTKEDLLNKEYDFFNH